MQTATNSGGVLVRLVFVCLGSLLLLVFTIPVSGASITAGCVLLISAVHLLLRWKSATTGSKAVTLNSVDMYSRRQSGYSSNAQHFHVMNHDEHCSGSPSRHQFYDEPPRLPPSNPPRNKADGFRPHLTLETQDDFYCSQRDGDDMRFFGQNQPQTSHSSVEQELRSTIDALLNVESGIQQLIIASDVLPEDKGVFICERQVLEENRHISSDEDLEDSVEFPEFIREELSRQKQTTLQMENIVEKEHVELCKDVEDPIVKSSDHEPESSTTCPGLFRPASRDQNLPTKPRSRLNSGIILQITASMQDENYKEPNSVSPEATPAKSDASNGEDEFDANNSTFRNRVSSLLRHHSKRYDPTVFVVDQLVQRRRHTISVHSADDLKVKFRPTTAEDVQLTA